MIGNRAERGASPSHASTRTVRAGLIAVAGLVAASVAPASAAQQREIGNDLDACRSGSGPALLVTVNGVKASSGKIRIQTYRATREDWMEKGRWINRIELPAKAGTMTFCLPVPESGTYGVAIRHDVNGNGKTDIGQDGGGISNNPSINIFNLGKPSYTKVGVGVGREVKPISIQMKYM